MELEKIPFISCRSVMSRLVRTRCHRFTIIAVIATAAVPCEMLRVHPLSLAPSMGFERQAQKHTYRLPLVPVTLTMLKCATLGLWHTHMSNLHPCCVVSLRGDNNKCCSCGRPSNLPHTTRNMSLTGPYVSQYEKELTKVPYAWTKEGP